MKVKVDSICTVSPETLNIISSNTEKTQNKTLKYVLDIEGGETYKLTTQLFDQFGFCTRGLRSLRKLTSSFKRRLYVDI